MEKLKCENCGQYKVTMRPRAFLLIIVGVSVVCAGMIQSAITNWGFIEAFAGIALCVWALKMKGRWCSNCRKLYN